MNAVVAAVKSTGVSNVQASTPARSPPPAGVLAESPVAALDEVSVGGVDEVSAALGDDGTEDVAGEVTAFGELPPHAVKASSPTTSRAESGPRGRATNETRCAGSGIDGI